MQPSFVCLDNSLSRYDVYLTKEPSVFESMALVHSRVRQVVFGIENKEDGGLGGTGDMTAVHCLPGTNHRYRAFKCIANDQNELYQYCRKLVDSASQHIKDNKNIH
jgi:Cytosine/adenosine deaminases